MQRSGGRGSFAFFLLLSTGGIVPAASAQDSRGSLSGADSLVLERTSCYGTCPAYRLSITMLGRVSFASRHPGQTSPAVRDSIPRERFVELLALADRLGLAALPDTIASDRALCPDKATDHPTTIVAIFHATHRKTIVDYHGCFASVDHEEVPAVHRLRMFEARIDSSAGSERWIRPAGRR